MRVTDEVVWLDAARALLSERAGVDAKPSFESLVVRGRHRSVPSERPMPADSHLRASLGQRLPLRAAGAAGGEGEAVRDCEQL